MTKRSIAEEVCWAVVLLMLQIACLCWLKSVDADTTGYYNIFVPIWAFSCAILFYGKWRGGDMVMAAAICLLVQLTAVFIAVSQSDLLMKMTYFGASQGDTSEAGQVRVQLIIYVVALALAVIFTCLLPKVLSFVNIHRTLGMWCCVVIDFLIWVPLLLNGRDAWIAIAGISVQLTELLKLTALMFYALLYLDPTGEPELTEVSPTVWSGMKRLSSSVWLWGLVFLLYNGIILVSLNEYGTLAVIALIYLTLQFVFDPRLKHTLVTVAVGLVGAGSMALAALTLPKRSGGIAEFLTQTLKLDKIGDRISSFLHPEADPYDTGYQINQAFKALENGGMMGDPNMVGPNSAVPEAVNDFAFVYLCQYMGAIFGIIYILLVLILVLRVAAVDSERQLMRSWFVGSAALLGWQTFMACGGAIGLLPIMGNPPIFIAQGGAFLTVTLSLLLFAVYGSTGVAKERSRKWKRKRLTRQKPLPESADIA